MTEGAVLVGDAAGWSDPLIGQGLAIAMRDARMISETLLSVTGWTHSAFMPYAEERAERMRRLRVRAQFDTELRCTFIPAGAARRERVGEAIVQDRDPLLSALVGAAFVGPENVPAAAFERENVERILALG